MFLGSNEPLRGAKSSIYEGGTRVPGFVYGRGVSQGGHVSNGLVHSSDWFPTIVAMAGGSTHGTVTSSTTGSDYKLLLIVWLWL